jgi:hypothetical protein
MPGLVPGIHAFLNINAVKAWMAGSSPAMTKWMSFRTRVSAIRNPAAKLQSLRMLLWIPGSLVSLAPRNDSLILMVRSGAKRRVSNHARAASSFETRTQVGFFDVG